MDCEARGFIQLKEQKNNAMYRRIAIRYYARLNRTELETMISQKRNALENQNVHCRSVRCKIENEIELAEALLDYIKQVTT